MLVKSVMSEVGQGVRRSQGEEYSSTEEAGYGDNLSEASHLGRCPPSLISIDPSVSDARTMRRRRVSLVIDMSAAANYARSDL